MSLLLLLDATKRFIGLQTKADITNTILNATLDSHTLTARITRHQTLGRVTSRKTKATLDG